MYNIKIIKEKLLHKIIDYIKLSKFKINEYFLTCPFCGQHIKLEVSISKDGNLKCPMCNKSANVFTLFKLSEKDLPEEEIIPILADRFNIYSELSKTHLDIIDAKKLAVLELTPLKPIIWGMVSQGLNIIAGSPKIGKSFLVLWICLQVAKGEDVWNLATTKGTTLYLSLEDNLVRLQDRLNKITDCHPNNMFFATQANKIKGGLDIQIENFIVEHRDTVLIVLDTFQKIRENAKDCGNIYANDYDDMCYLKTIADKYEIAIVIVHHTRKMTDSDPFNMISGSTGISGAADTMISLVKDSRMEGTATLQVTGRDTADKKLLLRFNREAFLWEMLSDDADEVLRQQEVDNSPIIKSIITLMNDCHIWKGTPTELLSELSAYTNELPKGANALSQKLNGYTSELKSRGIEYSKSKSGDGRTIIIEKMIVSV